MHRFVPWIITGLVIVLLLFMGLRTQASLVEVGQVRLAPLSITIEEEGQTRVVNRFEIFSPVAGYMRRVNLDVGDQVSKTQSLAELEPLPSDVLDPRRRATAKARVAGAKSARLAAEQQVEAAAADAEYARSEFERKNRLSKNQAVSQEELQQARTILQRTEAQLRSAQFAVDISLHELEAAENLLKYSAAEQTDKISAETVLIRSPINGSVLKILRKSEGVVAAGEPLLEVGNPLDLEVVVDVLSADAVRIKPGTSVELKRWGGDVLNASVKRIEPVAFRRVSALGVDEQRVLVVVEILSPTEQWLRLGDAYRVDANFVLWREDGVLQVPESALFRDQEKWACFVVEEGEAVLRYLKLGQRNGLQAQILEGIDEGDVIILYPDEEIESGSRVRVRS